MPATNSEALPNGVKVRGGAYLVEEVLAQSDSGISYHAYDVPSRCAVVLHEFFPPGARREEFQVRAPAGWSTQGFDLAKAKWVQRHAGALAIFDENGTAFLVTAVGSPPVPVQPEYSVPAPIEPTLAANETIAPTAPISTARRRLSFSDLWPDALRGAVQGSLLCGVSGVLLGALAATFGEGDFVSGAQLGAWAFPVGALCGALLGVLRALPSNAPALASASSLTPQQQLRSTLAGALKGGVLGLPLGILLIVAAAANGNEISLSSVLRGVLLFTLAGAIGGAVVGFIRINPRDRSRF